MEGEGGFGLGKNEEKKMRHAILNSGPGFRFKKGHICK